MAEKEEKITEENNEQNEESEPTQEEDTDIATSSGGNLTTPEGIFMLMIAAFFDGLTMLCVLLILVFGIGAVLAKVVYVFAFIFITAWGLFRSGSLPTKRGSGGIDDVLKKKAGQFFKKHWKKMAVNLIPVVGDLIPYWTIIVYKELKS